MITHNDNDNDNNYTNNKSTRTHFAAVNSSCRCDRAPFLLPSCCAPKNLSISGVLSIDLFNIYCGLSLINSNPFVCLTPLLSGKYLQALALLVCPLSYFPNRPVPSACLYSCKGFTIVPTAYVSTNATA